MSSRAWTWTTGESSKASISWDFATLVIPSSWRLPTTVRAQTRSSSSTSPPLRTARDTIIELARHTAEEVFIPFTIGGGIRTVDDARALLRAGADKVSVNSAVVVRPELVREIADEFGSQCVVVSVDAKSNGDGPGGSPTWNVYVKGGREDTGIDALEWVRQVTELGAGEILLTSMDADGTTAGFDLELTRAVADAVGNSCDRERRCWHAPAPGRRSRHRPCRRGARSLDLPFRRAHDCRRQASADGRRRRRATALGLTNGPALTAGPGFSRTGRCPLASPP